MRVDARRTFRTVIASSSNRGAIELARRVARGARDAPNPLLLWGRTGVGKTLLLAAVANSLARRGSRLVTLTLDEFRHDYVRAIRSGTMAAFRRALVDCDALIVDELEDAVGYPSTLAELQCAINVAIERGNPVLLASVPTSTFEVEEMVRGYPRGGIAPVREPTIEQRRIALERHMRLRRSHVSGRRLRALAGSTRSIGEARAKLDALLLSRQLDR